MKKVSVLLSTYNGEKYLREQIDSVLAQEGVEITLFVRDDGSSDGTKEILKEYAEKGLLTYTAEKNVGFAKSFFWLVCNAPRNDFYAFCDQDDYWRKDKLFAAAEKLSVFDNAKPNLYYSALKVVDENLVQTHASTHSGYTAPPAERVFPSSLMQNWVYGCTMVFNEELRRLYSIYDQPLYCHDWTMYQIAAGLGNVVFDEVPHIDYRQHGTNVYGFFKSGFNALKKNLKLFFEKESKNLRLTEAEKYKACYYEMLSETNKKYLDELTNYRRSRKDKRAFKKDKAFKEKGIVGFYHKILITFNKL